MYSTIDGERFTVAGTTLGYTSEGGSRWELIAEQILLIGEATAEAGERNEHWQLCFVTNIQGDWREGSLYAEGRNEALQWLSIRLGCSLELKLAGATAFRSRVMWPLEWREQPLFTYQVNPWRMLFSRSLRRFGARPLSDVQTVHPRLLERLWRARRSRSAAPAHLERRM